MALKPVSDMSDAAARGERLADRTKLAKVTAFVFNWHLLGYGTWLFPIIMAVVGYTSFAPLRQHVSSASLESVALLLLASVIIGMAWLVVQMLLVTNRKTPIGSLQFDASLSTALLVGASFMAGWMMHAGVVGWWFVTPAAIIVIDAFASSHLAINNAATRRTLQDDVIVS